MSRFSCLLYLFAFALTSETAFAVDYSSSSYQTGYWVGKIFMIVLAVLIIRKVFFKKS